MKTTNPWRKISPTDLLQCTAHGGAILGLLRIAARRFRFLERPVDAVQRTLERYTDRRAEAFDRRYGTETFARAPLDSIGLDKAATGYEWEGWLYGPVNEAFLREIIRHTPAAPEDLVFIDVGAGKGKAVMIAAEYPFRRVIGVELSDHLIATAHTNLARYAKARTLAAPVEFVCCDFMTWEVPRVPAVFFFNNPFPNSIALRAIRHIEKSLERRQRTVLVAYRKASDGVVTQLNNSPHFELVSRTPFWRIHRSRH